MSGLTRLEEHIPALRRYAWALLRNDGDADDLVQDCLVKALDRMDTLVGEGAMRPWLFSIMHNLSVSRWRSLRVRAAVMVDSPQADASVAPRQQVSAELEETLRNLANLPSDQQRVLLLVGVEGFEYGEAALILGVPIGTVMSRLSRARDSLRGSSQRQQKPLLRRVK